MSSATNLNIKNAATELATLQDMLSKFKAKEDILQKSLAGYSDKYHVTVANIPRDIKVINKVLTRFFETNKIKDIFDLVDNKPDFLNSAIEFTKNPVKGASRAVYNEAYMTLKTIKNNLDEYKNFSSENAQQNKNNDGFKNYVKVAQLILDVKIAYEELMLYTGAPELNLNDLPKSVSDLKNKQLAIAAPPSVEKSADAANEEADDTIDEDGKFEIGSKPYLALINKSARETATTDITQRKYACYQEAINLRLEYNNCVTKNQNDSTNLDLICAPLETRYEISKANCDSHFLSVTISDAVIDSIFANIEKVHMRITNGEFVVDQSSSAKAANDYNSVGNILMISPPTKIEGVSYANEFSQIQNAMKSVSDNALKLLGADVQSIGCGDSCDS